MNNYKKIATLETHNNVQMITALRDGRIVSCGKTIDIWKEVDGKWGLDDIVEQTINWIYSVIQLSDGNLVSGRHDGTLKIWKEEEGTWRYEATLEGHSDYVMSVIQLSDGRIASASKDKTIKIWKKVDGVWICEHTLEGHSDCVMSVIQLSDGRIASASKDKTRKIWDLRRGVWICEHTLVGHTDVVYSIIELKDGRLVSASYDKTIKIWKEVDGKWDWEQTLFNDGYLFTAIAIKDDQFLICGSGTSINIWEMEKTIGKDELIQIGNGLSSKTIGNSTVIFDKDTNVIVEIICNQEIIYKYNVDIKDKDFNKDFNIE